MSSPRVLILGASGRLGQALLQRFSAAGWSVVAQTRRPLGTPLASGGTPWVTGDRTFSSASPAGPFDAVVHAVNPAYTDQAWQRDALPLLEATISLARQYRALLMFPGNVYNYGRPLPSLIRESLPQRPSSVKGRVRAAMEARLRDVAAHEGVRSVVIRSGDFFGVGTGSWFDQVIAKPLPKACMGYPFATDVSTPWAYLPDLAEVFVQVAQQRARLGAHECLHMAGHTLNARDWQVVLTPWAQAQGYLAPKAELPIRGLPWPLIRVGAWFSPTWASMVDVREQYRTAHALDGSRLQALLGCVPHTPLPVAVAQALHVLGMGAGAPALAQTSTANRHGLA
jgi:nucleoside-diphosphate-sugar epimerase